MNNIDNGIKNPFRFYEKIEFQTRHKALTKNSYNVFNLLCPYTRLLPFQLCRKSSPFPLTSVAIMNEDDTLFQEILPNIPANDLKFFMLQDEDYILYYGNEDVPMLSMPSGNYYVRITDGLNIWYSEVFKAVDISAGCYNVLTFCNCSPIGGVLYGNDFNYKNKLYLPGSIGAPEYETEEEGYEDGNGVFYQTAVTQIKRYTAIGNMPEYMTDAVNLMALCDVIFLKLQSTQNEARIRDVKVTTKWSEDADFAETNIVFREQVVVKNTCCLGPELMGDYRERHAKDVLCTIIAGDYEFCYGAYVNMNQMVQLETGDLVFIYDDNTMTTGGVYRYNSEFPPGYQGYNDWFNYDFVNYNQEGNVVYSIREGQYYLYIDDPLYIWSIGPRLKLKALNNATSPPQVSITGVAFPQTAVLLYKNQPGAGVSVFIPEGAAAKTSEEFHQNGFTVPYSASFYKIKNYTHSQDFGLSNYL